jgi:RNase adaptor protein for sRNA GlmZ degradation
MNFLGKLFGGNSERDPASEPVIIVSGLPRSGTSMMMKMLEAGGLHVYIDNLRTPDADNPEGYYEFERVKQLDKGDTDWVREARGQVVKVISALLEYLPSENEYRVLFMHRSLDEILASQQKMLSRRNEAPSGISDEEMADLFRKHLTSTDKWLREQPNFAVLDVDYNQMLADPAPLTESINQFLGGVLDEGNMVAVINPDLYRNRA